MSRLIAIAVFVGIFVALVVSESHAGCPVGSYEWVDNWGNKVCKGFDTGENRTIEGSLSKCPTGSYPWVDSWGNRICQSFEGNQRYYDTSRGCPVGTYQWVDNWGNSVCKPF